MTVFVSKTKGFIICLENNSFVAQMRKLYLGVFLCREVNCQGKH